MQLLEFPIRRYQFTLVAFLCLVALGMYAFVSIPREEDPYIKLPAFIISAVYPGADPKDLERLVAKPIEDRLAELEDVHKMETTIVDGVAFIGDRVRGLRRRRGEVRRGHARGQRAAADAARRNRSWMIRKSVPALRQHRAVGAGLGRRALQRTRGSWRAT